MESFGIARTSDAPAPTLGEVMAEERSQVVADPLHPCRLVDGAHRTGDDALDAVLLPSLGYGSCEVGDLLLLNTGGGTGNQGQV